MEEVKMNENGDLLTVKDLIVEYHSGGETIHAVNGVHFSLKAGETIGLVGGDRGRKDLHRQGDPADPAGPRHPAI